ncbi:DUF697 domain-containing protein [Halothiobacillus sp. DCM-1]|uniref:DUF697 domain-containing protein n=1 Tax=Halothiobacillus sp. DCM-1 TaxID=3112558 RepID=UPI003248C0C2
MSHPAEEVVLPTKIHAIGEAVPAIDPENLVDAGADDAASADLLPPTRSHGFTRLLTAALLIWLAVSWGQTVVWGWALSAWLGGGLLAIGIALLLGFLALGWQARRARVELDALSAAQAQWTADLAQPLPVSGDVVARLHAVQALYPRSPHLASLKAAVETVDAGWTLPEAAALLRQWYAPQDRQAVALVKREALKTGIFIAASPYPALDLLLVAWRNAAMVERVAGIYGIRWSAAARWRLYQLILRNIAFTTVTETVLDSASQTWLSNLLMQVGARAGQGVGVALYSLRIGQQAMRLCRVLPASETLISKNLMRLVVEELLNRSPKSSAQ